MAIIYIKISKIVFYVFLLIISQIIFNTLSRFLATLYKIYAKFEFDSKFTIVFSY